MQQLPYYCKLFDTHLKRLLRNIGCKRYKRARRDGNLDQKNKRSFDTRASKLPGQNALVGVKFVGVTRPGSRGACGGWMDGADAKEPVLRSAGHARG